MPGRGTSTTRRPSEESHWTSRPASAWTIRVYSSPWLRRWFRSSPLSFWPASFRPTPWVSTSSCWWDGLFAVGLIVLLASDSLARRMLPLVALFKLSLIFPDQAPQPGFSTACCGPGRPVSSSDGSTEAQASGRLNQNANYATTMLEMVAALQRARSPDPRPLRTGAGLHRSHRRGDGPGRSVGQQAPLVVAAARRRQADGPPGDPHQDRSANRRGMGDPQDPSNGRRQAHRPAETVARRVAQRRFTSITSGGTATATPSACPGTTSTSVLASSRWPTPSTS